MINNIFIKLSHSILHVYIQSLSSISSSSSTSSSSTTILSGNFNEPNATIYLESLFTLPTIIFTSIMIILVIIALMLFLRFCFWSLRCKAIYPTNDKDKIIIISRRYNIIYTFIILFKKS